MHLIRSVTTCEDLISSISCIFITVYYKLVDIFALRNY